MRSTSLQNSLWISYHGENSFLCSMLFSLAEEIEWAAQKKERSVTQFCTYTKDEPRSEKITLHLTKGKDKKHKVTIQIELKHAKQAHFLDK